MGINGLLPVIKPICQERHLQDLAHTRVGVDVYGWLHKGSFSCALNLCRGIDTAQYVHFCMHRVRMLIHFKVTPILVFDGADLPMKAGTHSERRERREESMRKAEEAFASGDKKKAEEWYQRAYTVTSEMARLVIRECRKINVEYVVAPYEADAQLAWMMKTGYIDGVITEDSDLLVYGAARILFKMNRFGNGDLFERKNLLSLDSLNMNNFSDDMFLYMAVCSGCDFFKGVLGLGVKKSHAIVKRFRTMPRLILAIRQDRRYKVQKSFAADFTRACLVFRHQTVFDMRTKQHVHLNDFDNEARARLPRGVLLGKEGDALDLSFLGTHRDIAVAKQIAEGLIHPRSLEEYIDPLDIVSRPVPDRVRARRLPSPPRRRRVQSDARREVRGFLVQPASVSNGARYSSSISLRQRLINRSSGAQTFNPRRIGAAFRAKQGIAAKSSGVWASFRNSREYARSVAEPNGTVTSARDDEVPKCDEDTSQANAVENHPPEQNENSPPRNISLDDSEGRQSPQRIEDEERENSIAVEIPELPGDTEHGEEAKLPDGSEPREDPKPQEALTDLDTVHSPKRCRVTSSHRVEAVNRAIGRFAQTEKKDLTKKFIPGQKSSSSPKEEDYDLLTDMDMVASRPEKTEKQASKQEVKSPIAKKLPRAPRPKSVTQVRLSRFFPPRKQSEKEETSKQTSRSVKPSGGGSKKNLIKQKAGIQKPRKQSGTSSLNKFRRGAVGRTAVASQKKL